MEHRPKRQRVSREGVGPSTNSESDGRPAVAVPHLNNKAFFHHESALTSLSSPTASPYITSPSQPIPYRPEMLLAPPAITSAPERVQRRQGIPAIETVVTSVVDIVLDSGTSQIAEITLDSFPTGPTVLSFPNYGPVTIAAVVTASVPTVPTVASVPNVPPLSPVGPLPTLPVVPESTAAASSTSMSIEMPGASSQIVMSSPPPTPLPSNTEMSFPTSSSTDTFSASVSSIGNSSTITCTSTGSGSSVTAASTFSTGYFAGNSTRTGLPSNSSVTAFGTGTALWASTSGVSLSATSSAIETASTGPSATGGLGASGGVGGLGNPTSTGAAGSATSSAAGGNGGSTTENSIQTPAVVGSVVGGLAGVTILLVLVLFLLRWKRRQMNIQQLRDGDAELAPPGTAGSGAIMTQTAAPLAGAGLAPFFRKLRPNSGQTTGTAETSSTERGFQNLGGRKIESVLVSGGDGYGGPAPGSTGNMSQTSFYRDSQGTYGRPGSLPSSMYVGPGSPPMSPVRPGAGATVMGMGRDTRTSDKEVAVMRSGPARTPVRTRGFSTTPPRSPLERHPSHPPLMRPDAVGRSLPGQDGSRGSKFAENLR